MSTQSTGGVTLGRKRRGQPPCVTACVRRQEGVFHWRKRLRFSAVCYRQGKRFSWYGAPCAADADNSTEELSICGDRRCIDPCHLDYSHCDHRLSTRRYFVTNGDRIPELVVSGNGMESSLLGLLNTVFNVFNLSGGGKPDTLNVLSVVSFKCTVCAAVWGDKKRCYRRIFVVCWMDFF